MQEKILSSVDPARFMQSSRWNFKQSWSGKVDVSVWLRATILHGGRVYVLLEYSDQEKTRIIPVDRCMSPSSEAMLLNGRIELVGKGAIKNIQLKLKYEGCDAKGFVLEELSLKAIPQIQQEVKPAAGAKALGAKWSIAV